MNSGKVEVTSNVYKSRILKTIYFENSVLGRTLGLMGIKYMSHSEKVKALSLIRSKNNNGRRL